MNIPALPREMSPLALSLGPVTLGPGGLYPAVWWVGDTCGYGCGPAVHQGFDAHAHCGFGNYGLICIRPEVAEDPAIQAHEYAHLLDFPLGRRWPHGPRWQRILSELGYPYEAGEYLGQRG